MVWRYSLSEAAGGSGVQVLARGLRVCAAAAAVLLSMPSFGDDLPPPISPGSDAPPPVNEQQPTAFGVPVPSWPSDSTSPKPKADAQIEQKHVGRRVSEVIVTPAGVRYHYTMIHLDEQEHATTLLQPHPELSVPRFLQFDF